MSLARLEHELRHAEREIRRQARRAGGPLLEVAPDRLDDLLAGMSFAEFGSLDAAVQAGDVQAQLELLEAVAVRRPDLGGDQGPGLAAAIRREHERRARTITDAMTLDEVEEIRGLMATAPNASSTRRMVERISTRALIRRQTLGVSRQRPYGQWGSCWWGAADCRCLADALDRPAAERLGRAGLRVLARRLHGRLWRRRASGAERRRRVRARRPVAAEVVVAAPAVERRPVEPPVSPLLGLPTVSEESLAAVAEPAAVPVRAAPRPGARRGRPVPLSAGSRGVGSLAMGESDEEFVARVANLPIDSVFRERSR